MEPVVSAGYGAEKLLLVDCGVDGAVGLQAVAVLSRLRPCWRVEFPHTDLELPYHFTPSIDRKDKCSPY